MTASVTVIKDPYFMFDDVDYSAQIKELSLPFSLDEIESTCSGDGCHVYVPGLEKFSMEAKGFRNNALDAAMWGAKGLVKTAKFRKSTAAKGPTNPEYSASVFVNSYPFFGGGVGAADEVSIGMSANTALGRDAA